MGQWRSCSCVDNAVVPETNNHVSPSKGSIGHAAQEALPARQRSCTDVVALILFILFIAGEFSLLGYCVYHGDIHRIVNGYDDCGNICGRDNLRAAEAQGTATGTNAGSSSDLPGGCLREDLTTKRYLVVNSGAQEGVRRICVENCENIGLRDFFNRCFPNKSEKITNSFLSKTGLSDFFEEVSEDLELCWKDIVYLCIIAFVFSIMMLVLFRFVVGFIVWLVLLGVALTTIIGTIFLWIMWAQEKSSYYSLSEESKDMVGKSKMYSYLVYAIAATVVTVVVLLVLLVMRKRISLVIQLFKEAGKAVASMPLILAEPVVTFTALAIAVGLWIYFALWIESAGFVMMETKQSVSYKKNVAIKVTRWYNLFALFWFTQFIIGCQHMVIAGAVASWFFSRNKSNMFFPSMRSLNQLTRYHMGTVAFGSLLIALVQMLRALLALLQKNLKGSTNKLAECILWYCQCCLYCFDKFLQYLSRNAYIETAIFGYGFCEAGQQAFRLLSNNALRVAAINSVGDFVLFLGKVFVVMVTILIGIELIQKKEGVHHTWAPLLVAGIAAYLTAHCFITVYEMAIDTIFICFCEDCERNDGITRPYYMSRGLMEFVQNSKKALEVLDNSSKQAWTGPNTISDKVE